MPGRYALIAASRPDDDVAALARLLADPKAGDFVVEEARTGAEVASFLADRHGTDVVLVYLAGAPVEPEALDACQSRHVLVISDSELDFEVRKGRALLMGVPARALVRALRGGRADRNQDGEITLKELNGRLRQTLQTHLRSGLDAPFVLARSPRLHQQARRERRKHRRSKRRVIFVGAGIGVLLAGLPLPWLFGGSGLELAFGAGTLWWYRIAALAGLALAVAAALHLWLRRGAEWVVVLVALTYGAQFGFAGLDLETGLGFGLSLLGPGLILAGTWQAGTRHTGVALAAPGAFIAAYNLVGAGSWLGVGVGVALLAPGCWLLARQS